MSYLIQSLMTSGGPSFRIQTEEYILSPIGKPGDSVIVGTINEMVNRLEQEGLIFVTNEGSSAEPITDIGMRTAPVLAFSNTLVDIGDASFLRRRVFIKGGSGEAVNPILPDGEQSDELWLFACDNTASVLLQGAANLQLSGDWLGVSGSILYLQWDNVSMWVEGDRNEI